MNTLYIIFSLIALPAVLMVLMPKDSAILEEEETATPQLSPAIKPAAMPSALPAHIFGRRPLHEYKPMPNYRIFYRAPQHQFF